MPCYSPMTMYRSRTGGTKLVGLAFGDVMQPVKIPCGKCVGCLLERSRVWAIRCMHQAQISKTNCFITLTYKDENLTYGKDRATLYPRDLQLFFKRYRKKYGNGIKYFACGEYGEKNGRPHYHACVFGHDFHDRIFYSQRNGIDIFDSKDLSDLWGLGDAKVGDVTFDSCAYVARYILKKRLGPAGEYYKREGIIPEFTRMSRRPGIGLEWLKKYESDVFPRDTVSIRGGIKGRPPRYYFDKYALDNPEKAEYIKERRKEAAEKAYDENTPKRLRIRRIVKEAQLSRLIRNL